MSSQQVDQYGALLPSDGTTKDKARLLKQWKDMQFALDESSIVAMTDKEGTIHYVNNNFCEISQYSREELIGSTHRIVNSGYHTKAFMKHLWDTITSGEVWKGELKNRKKDGEYYWVDTTIVPFLDEHKVPYQYLSIRHEVTKRKQMEEELRQMMTRVMNVQEGERKRISRDLHDTIGQSLFSLLIQVDRLHQDIQHEGLSQIRLSLNHVMEDVRNMAREMRPSVLDDLGVVPAIRSYIQNYSKYFGIDVHFECSLKSRLDKQVETAMFRIVQEALTNVSKYADVEEVSVAILECRDNITARIEDSGVGFIFDHHAKGVGIFSMQERTKAIGGNLKIDTEPGEGTKIYLSIPKVSEKQDKYMNVDDKR
ncbi:PAS domain-containing sensor histidine kinase [Longirhabdus pacifica]|uniref:PAS domain-containing sensor histidine kinase n=1 Tax=Longirhabdus pacifica TaxID=2305227 RepID=UPI0010088A1C|nr:PAS domain-containing sensor histidine kinase [Longirhabdus pacifica]